MSISPALVRFGVFELDLNTGELLKTGRRLKLQEQSFRVLRLLLEQPGQVVRRERMKEELWPSDTFVDFDHSLNAAIAKLRQALGDSAETPRFVETVARRGYRFIAPVDTVPSSAPNGAGTDAAAKETAAVPSESKQTARGKTVLTRIGAAGLVTLGVVGLVVALRWLRTPENPNSAVLHRITFDAGLTMDPTVSRDGSLLAYSSDKGSDGPLNLWVQQLRGSGPIRVTHSNADDHAPSFSPDGAQLVFRSEREPRGIYVVPSFGGAARFLVADGQGPRFSPDGKWIVLLEQRRQKRRARVHPSLGRWDAEADFCGARMGRAGPHMVADE